MSRQLVMTRTRLMCLRGALMKMNNSHGRDPIELPLVRRKLITQTGEDFDIIDLGKELGFLASTLTAGALR